MASINTNRTNDAYIISVIGEGSIFHGDLNLQGVLHINGDFYGTISTIGDVAIGITGRAQCQIEARNVVVSGVMQGQILASSSVHLNNSAVLIGDVEAASLTIEPHALIQGQIRTNNSTVEPKRLESNNSTVQVFDVWRK